MPKTKKAKKNKGKSKSPKVLKAPKAPKWDRETNIDYIIEECYHLDNSSLLDILKMVNDQVGKEAIYESSDGSRIEPDKLPNEIVRQIKELIQTRISSIDIASSF